MRDRELYEACDTEVKRQIWKDSQALFGDEVSPLLTGYITSKEDTLFNVENLNNLFFNPSPKVIFLFRFFIGFCLNFVSFLLKFYIDG